MRILYCWRCTMDIPMLDTMEEMDRVLPHLIPRDVANALAGRQKALDEYFAITGFRETEANALWHHVAHLYGPPCRECGTPLRTPKATMCPQCGVGVAAPPTP